jgi:hypothetical protein
VIVVPVQDVAVVAELIIALGIELVFCPHPNLPLPTPQTTAMFLFSSVVM